MSAADALGEQWKPLSSTPLGHSARAMDVDMDDRGNIMRGADAARTRPVRIADLHAGGRQTEINQAQIDHYRQGGASVDHTFALSPSAPVVVRDKQNQHHIVDGHHRILAAMANGETEMHMKVYDASRKRYL